MLAYGVLLAADIHADRAAMGVTTALFFVLLGAALIACALVRRARAAPGPGARSWWPR